MATVKWKDVSVTPQKLSCIKREHLKWIKEMESLDTAQAMQSSPPHDLTGAIIPNGNFNGADLRRINFSNATLTSANFKETNLGGADLSGADLSSADLSRVISNDDDFCPDNPRNVHLGKNNNPAILRCTNFNGANLTGVQIVAHDVTNAQFKNACLDHVWIHGGGKSVNLARSDFTEARLRHADLETVKNLHDHQLIQADLSSADLPKNVESALMSKIDALVRAASHARKLFTPLLLTCLTMILAVYISDGGKIRIPTIPFELEYSQVMTIMPLTVILLYIWFLFYMSRLWDLLSVMPAFFVNGLPIHKYPDPWFLLNFPRPFFKYLKEKRIEIDGKSDTERSLQEEIRSFLPAAAVSFLAELLAYWSVPFLIFVTWRIANVPDDSLWIEWFLPCSAVCVSVIGAWCWRRGITNLRRPQNNKKSSKGEQYIFRMIRGLAALTMVISLIFIPFLFEKDAGTTTSSDSTSTPPIIVYSNVIEHLTANPEIISYAEKLINNNSNSIVSQSPVYDFKATLSPVFGIHLTISPPP